MQKRSIFTILLSALLLTAHAQESTRKQRHDSLRRYRNTQDTNYVRKYPDRLIITLYQSYRQYDVRFSQGNIMDTSALSSHRFIADANVSTGLAVDFDKISFSFGIKSAPPTAAAVKKKGNTDYSTFSVSLNAYRFRIETSYRKYQGFYDINSPKYLPDYADSTPYYNPPNMSVRSLRAKTLFIFNKRRFSYNAAYSNTFRQVKSAGSWLMMGNLYSYRFSANNSFFPLQTRYFYDEWGFLDKFYVSGLSFGPGATYNLVIFKRLYLNMTLNLGLDMQRHYLHTNLFNQGLVRWRPGFASDFRAALGFNSRNFFMSGTFKIDYNLYNPQFFVLEPRFFAADFNIGYRFPFKKRNWVKKLQENEWYKLL